MNKISQQRPLFFSIGLVLSCLLVITAFEWKIYPEQEVIDLEHSEYFDIPNCILPDPPLVYLGEVVEIEDKKDLGDTKRFEIQEFEKNEELKTAFLPPKSPWYSPPKPKMLDLNCFGGVEDSLEFDVDFVYPFELLDSPTNKVINDTSIYIAPEENAHPKEGYKAFYKFITQNLHYPDSTKKVGVEGKIFIQFVVEKNGSLSNFKILKGDSQMSEEAIRVLKITPKWVPARQNGVVVRSRYAIPIYIHLK